MDQAQELPGVQVVVPTLNAGLRWKEWLLAMKAQSFPFRGVEVVDSESSDGTTADAESLGYAVAPIKRRDFNHGGTRQQVVDRLSEDIDIVVFLTQDAILDSPQSIANLIAAFDDPDVDAAFGRQIPHLDSGPIGAHARHFNYPPNSRVVSEADIDRLGIRAAFLSNSFAAYRVRALKSVGGFPVSTIMNEDLTVAARLLLAGRRLAYRADAVVRHSHDYTIAEEFKRYFDIGVFFARESWIIKRFGSSEGEGSRFVRSEWRYLLRHGPALLPSAIVRTFAKYAGYRLGMIEASLPSFVKRSLSMHRRYWG